MADEQKFDTPGKMTLWRFESDNENAPTLKGHFYSHRAIHPGEKISVALWRNERGAEGPQFPVLTGKVSDVMRSTAPVHDAVTTTRSAPPPPPPANDDDFDDDIPF